MNKAQRKKIQLQLDCIDYELMDAAFVYTPDAVAALKAKKAVLEALLESS